MFDAYKCSIASISNFGKDSILCYPCLQKLGKWSKHEKEINQIKEQITTFLQRFMPAPTRKRAQPTDAHENITGSQTPVHKRPRRNQAKRISDVSKVSVSISLISRHMLQDTFCYVIISVISMTWLIFI